MAEETKRRIHRETAQNWIAFSFIVFGIGLGAAYSYSWAIYLVAFGLMLSLFLIIKRTLSKKPKKFSVLTIVSILCWGYILLSYILTFLPLPSIFGAVYGYDLGGLYNWGMTLLFAGAVGLVSTIIELFRTSNNRAI